MKLNKSLILSKELILRTIAIILIVVGINLKDYSLHLLLLSGIVLGTYYGLYNDIIWRPKGELSPSFPYRAHQLWIHIICGIVGSVALYFLLGAIDINNKSVTLEKLGLTEFILFIVTILGYVGLLPRIIWFFSYAQSVFSPK